MNELLTQGTQAEQGPVQSHSPVISSPPGNWGWELHVPLPTKAGNMARWAFALCLECPGFTERGEGIHSQVTQMGSHFPSQSPRCTYMKVWTCVRQSGKSQGPGKGHMSNFYWVIEGWVGPCGGEGWCPASFSAFPQSGISTNIEWGVRFWHINYHLFQEACPDFSSEVASFLFCALNAKSKPLLSHCTR